MSPTNRDTEVDYVAVNEVFELLSNPYRRWMLRYLTERPNEEVPFDELTDYLSRECPAAESENLAINLVHIHLPKMTEYGIVEYDSTLDTVKYQPHHQLEAVLTLAGETS